MKTDVLRSIDEVRVWFMWHFHDGLKYHKPISLKNVEHYYNIKHEHSLSVRQDLITEFKFNRDSLKEDQFKRYCYTLKEGALFCQSIFSELRLYLLSPSNEKYNKLRDLVDNYYIALSIVINDGVDFYYPNLKVPFMEKTKAPEQASQATTIEGIFNKPYNVAEFVGILKTPTDLLPEKLSLVLNNSNEILRGKKGVVRVFIEELKEEGIIFNKLSNEKLASIFSKQFQSLGNSFFSNDVGVEAEKYREFLKTEIQKLKRA